MHIAFISLFPRELQAFICKGILQKAVDKNLVRFSFINLRDFAINRYGQVDDPPYGGRRGMLLRPDVIYDAVTSVFNYQHYAIYYTCPKGPIMSQPMVTDIQRNYPGLIIIAGYYEGIDERIFELLPVRRFSIGTAILSSGDAAAAALTEGVCRLIPGVIGDPACIDEDSFVSGTLEHPQYTSPRVFKNLQVPDILLSGHHQKVAAWKRRHALATTLFNKPELLVDCPLSSEDQIQLTEFLKGAVP